jgi:hypothetical protein
MLFKAGPLQFPEALGILVGRNNEGNGIRTRQRNFLDHARHDGLAGFGLSLLYGRTDVRQLGQRVVGVHLYQQLPARGQIHIAAKLQNVLRMKGLEPVARGQLPGCLGVRCPRHDKRGNQNCFHGELLRS